MDSSPTKISSPTKGGSSTNSPTKLGSNPTSPQKVAQNSTSPTKSPVKSNASSPKKVDSQPTSPTKQASPLKDVPKSPMKSPSKAEAESPIKLIPTSNVEAEATSPVKQASENGGSPVKQASKTGSPVKQTSEVAEPHSPDVEKDIQAKAPIATFDFPTTSILIVAANGKLGSAITEHCLARTDLLVNILVRDLEKNQSLVDSVRVKGGKAFQGDVTQPETLDEATKGMHTVISCVNTVDEKVGVEGQNNLLQASIKNGVRRFVPSDFGVNYTKFTKEELERSSIVYPKIKFQELLDKSYIIQLHFYQGMIMEMFFQLQAQGFSYWGDDNFKLELTCYDDIAKAVAVVVSEPYLSGHITYVGQRLTHHEIGEIYSRVRGEKKEPHKNGEIEDLKIAYEEKRKEGVFDAEILGLYLLTTDERSLFGKDNNEALPTVPATTVEEFLKKHPDVKLP